jgi:hypothetical protein
MKACENCSPLGAGADRVCIGKNHKKVSFFQQIYGVILIYVPIITMPFVFFSAYTTYLHLRLMGAKNLKTLSDYLPERKTHRYTLKSQIVMRPGYSISPTQSKFFWIFNCTWYCPVSVALFEWHAYLVKLVENWWCPFTHGTKENYRNAAIDKSFWHIFPDEITKLDKADLNNPIWNESSAKEAKATSETKD